MKAARFDYLKPETLDQALRELARGDLNNRLVAGSQSLGPMLNLRLVRPDRLMDVSGLADLRTVKAEGGQLRIGAGITHAEIEDGRHPALRDHPWRRIAGTIAYRSVRNRGTIGGSLAHADPAADWLLAAWAAGAQIEIIRGTGTRIVPVHQFMLAAYTTVLEPDEMVAAVLLPESLGHAPWGYYKVCRKIGDFAEASCAVAIDPVRGVCRVAVGALDGPPVLLEGLAAELLDDIDRSGPNWAERVARHVSLSLPDMDAIGHRRLIATVMRAVDRAFEREVVSA